MRQDTLVAAVVEMLKTMPELVDALGGSTENVINYEDGFGVRQPIEKAIQSAPAPSVTVYSDGKTLAEDGNFDHTISMVIREAHGTSPHAIADAIENGTPANCPHHFIVTPPHEKVYSPSTWVYSRTLDLDSNVFYLITVTYREIDTVRQK